MRAWLIGNGPSLAHTPLHLLAGETCFATGRIHLLFDQTVWRPTHYVRVEESGIDIAAWADDVKAVLTCGAALYLSAGFRGHYHDYNLRQHEQPGTRVEWVETCDGNHGCGWHLPRLCFKGGSLLVAIQIAISEGYEPLYLLGCDLGNRHFCDDYERGEVRKDDTWLRIGHAAALMDSPVAIYNATLGGNLNMYERVDMLDVLNGN